MAPDDPAGARPAPVALRIKLRYDDVEALTERFASHVGRSGLFLPTRSLQPVGTEVKFELRLLNDQPVLRGLGRVRTVREPDPAHPTAVYGLGIELMRVTPESRELILKLLARRRQLGLPEVALPHPDDIDAARREAEASGVPAPAPSVVSAPVAAPVVAAVPSPIEPSPSAPQPAAQAASGGADSLLTAPRRTTGPVATPAALSIAPLPPEAPRRKRRAVSEVIESASGPAASSVSIPELDEEVDVGRALARARTLAGGDLDQELEQLRDQAAAPLAEISVEVASAELARQLGGVGVRRARSQGWAPPPAVVADVEARAGSAPAVPEPAEIAAPETAEIAALEPAAVAVPETARIAALEPAAGAMPEPAELAVPEPAELAAPETAEVAALEPAAAAVPETARISALDPAASEPAPSEPAPPEPVLAAEASLQAELEAGVIERDAEDVAHLHTDARRGRFVPAHVEQIATDPVGSLAEIAAGLDTPGLDAPEADAEHTLIGSRPLDPSALDEPAPSPSEVETRRVPYAAGLHGSIATVSYEEAASPPVEAAPPPPAAPEDPEEEVIEEIEEIDEFEIIAEADAADADLLTAFGEGELAARPQVPPPAADDFASRLALDDDSDFYTAVSEVGLVSQRAEHERAPLTLDPRELSAGHALAALEGADAPSDFDEPGGGAAHPAPHARYGSPAYAAVAPPREPEHEFDSHHVHLAPPPAFEQSELHRPPPEAPEHRDDAPPTRAPGRYRPPTRRTGPVRTVRPASTTPSGRGARPRSEDGILINFDDDDDPDKR